VRRILDLAAALPGLRRVDLVTNRRCPAVVVERATRLVEHNRERFAKRIVARADAPGSIVLAADPSDDVSRARHLLASWGPALRGGEPPSHAVLARTNGELAPYAAAALEAGLTYRAEVDGLDALDDPGIERLLAAMVPSPAGKPAAALEAGLTCIAPPPPIASSSLRSLPGPPTRRPSMSCAGGWTRPVWRGSDSATTMPR
jgi:superfamily I DNA/RNA helicase